VQSTSTDAMAGRLAVSIWGNRVTPARLEIDATVRASSDPCFPEMRQQAVDGLSDGGQFGSRQEIQQQHERNWAGPFGRRLGVGDFAAHRLEQKACCGVERRLTAIPVADVAGYGQLMETDGARTVRDLKAHQAVLLPMVSEFGGRIIDTTGDGILAEFASAVKALECAMAIQRRALGDLRGEDSAFQSLLQVRGALMPTIISE
jgi:class 3 adenylate cyclase